MLRWTQQLLGLAVCVAVLCSSGFSGVVICEASGGHHAIEVAHQPGDCADRDASAAAPEDCQDRVLGVDVLSNVTRTTAGSFDHFFAAVGMVAPETSAVTALLAARLHVASDPCPPIGIENHLKTVILLI